ncbi:hypothetical protein AUJ78_00390 [Candidatus Peregrinibacteria bacterium CG1_02_41_10]|nr:MAG: hypothetical protein AUJ78_00390 [Candidatus Peregrinibacteria bacterium CG1_02_41_10]
MTTARKVLSSTLIQIVGKVGTAALGLVSIKILAQYLSVSEFGQYTTVYQYLAFFGIIADLGLFTIAIREMSKDLKQVPYILGNVLTIRLVLVILSVLLSMGVVVLVPQYRGSWIPWGVVVAGGSVVLALLNGTLTSVLQTYLKMGIATLATVVGKAVSVGFMLFVVWVWYAKKELTDPTISNAFYWLIAASIAGNLVMLILTYFETKRFTEIKLRFDFSFWKKLLWTTLPYGIALFLNTVYLKVDIIILSLLKGDTEVGIYGVAAKVLELTMIVPQFFLNSLLPVLARYLKEQNQKIHALVQHSFDFLFATALPIVGGVYVLAYPFVFAFADPKFLSRLNEGYYGSDIALQIIIFTLIFTFLANLFGYLLVALNQQTKLLWINLACVVCNVVLNFIFIPYWGFRAAAATTILSEIVMLILSYLYVRCYFKLQLRFKNTFKITLAALLMTLVVYWLQPLTYRWLENWNLLLLVPLGAVVYGGLLIVLKVITRELWQEVRGE